MLIGAATVALFTIPATLKELSIAHSLAAPTLGNANFITRDERSALNYLAHNKDPGSVMTRAISAPPCRAGPGGEPTSATACGPSPGASR